MKSEKARSQNGLRLSLPISLFALHLSLAWGLATTVDVEAARPSFVVILVDDLRWNALGCMGNPVVQTPHIDALAKRGTLFKNAFVTTSICAVSRANYFTGQWMSRHGIVDFKTGLTASQWAETYPGLLRSAGYRTGFIGKYGVGSPEVTAAKEKDFDFWRGRPQQAGRFFFDADDPTHTHATARFGNQALEFLEGCEPGKPFCLSVSFNAVHARDHEEREYEPDPRDEMLYEGVQMPISPLATEEAYRKLPEFVQTSEGRRRWRWRFDEPEKMQRILRDYYRLITGVDREVGRIVEKLAAKGLTDETMIVFTSDNGYALADRGMADKWYMYEEDIRVAMIVADPRVKPADGGRTSDAMVLSVDVAPTMLDAAGIERPAAMQGRSMLPMVRGDRPPSDWRTEYFYEHPTISKNRIPASQGIRTTRWKYIRWTESVPLVEELFDLETDPLEQTNLVNAPNHAVTLAELRGKWDRYRNELK